MQLTGLKSLYADMKRQKLERTIFKVLINNISFEVIYFIDSSPHSLAIGVKGKNFFFEIPVEKGFHIKTWLGENYSKVCEILGLKYDETNKYSSNKFFSEINKGIPSKVTNINIPTYKDIAPYRRDVEEADRIYFYGWKENDKTGGNVKPKNLEKTRAWLGENAFRMCKKYNVSSRWTDVSSDEKAYALFEVKKNRS